MSAHSTEMTQQQALESAQDIFPGSEVTVSRERFIGFQCRNHYYVWKSESGTGCGKIVGSSHDSWEGALIEARAAADHPVAADVPFEDETSALSGESAESEQSNENR